MENALEIKGLNKKFERFKVENITFNLEKGSVMGLIGPNGSGKTTIIKSIMGLYIIDSGEIRVLGENLSEKEIVKDKIGFVYDEVVGFKQWTIEKNRDIISGFYSKWDNEVFEKYLKRFKLDRHEKLGNLSKGKKMRYSLAIALSHNAELLILDEPTAGLDAVARMDFLDIIFELVEEKEISVLYSSHITADLEKIADYITFINNGKVIFSLEKEEVLSRFKIVKGGLEELTEEVMGYIQGIRKYKYGFEGITEHREALDKINKNLVFEDATLDEIIVGFSKE